MPAASWVALGRVFNFERRLRGTLPVFINIIWRFVGRKQRQILLGGAQLQDNRQWAQTEILKIPFKLREKKYNNNTNISYVNVIKNWCRLLWEAVKSPSLEMLKPASPWCWAACCSWPYLSRHGTSQFPEMLTSLSHSVVLWFHSDLVRILINSIQYTENLWDVKHVWWPLIWSDVAMQHEILKPSFI